MGVAVTYAHKHLWANSVVSSNVSVVLGAIRASEDLKNAELQADRLRSKSYVGFLLHSWAAGGSLRSTIGHEALVRQVTLEADRSNLIQGRVVLQKGTGTHNESPIC